MPIFEILASIIGLGKSAGLIKSPEDEAKLQVAAMAAAAQKDTAFAQFVAATSPTDNPRWVNAIISLIRPLITAACIFLVAEAVYNPAVAAGIKAAGIDPHWLFLPPLWWFTGRTAEKITGIVTGNGTN